jgi:adenosine deaminase
VRSIEDPDTVARLKREGIHLEVCPACNVQINICNTYADHPIDRLYRAGVSLGVNTDTRGVTDTTLTHEYMLLAEHFGWTAADFLRVNVDALAASFAPKGIKDKLAERLRREYAPFLAGQPGDGS